MLLSRSPLHRIGPVLRNNPARSGCEAVIFTMKDMKDMKGFGPLNAPFFMLFMPFMV